MCVDVCGDERGGEWSGGEGDGQRQTRGFNFWKSITVTYPK
jgi:hypothetical protein